MQIKTIIIGKRSNLSKELSQNIENTVVLSGSKLLENEKLLSTELENSKCDIIINAFYPAKKLSQVDNPMEYIKYSIGVLSNVLESLGIYKESINKVIYTSSASVYGNNNYCKEEDILTPLSLQASLKISSEELLESFCNKNCIDYTIARVFNMYGGDDSFSIISKIINISKSGQELTLTNDGTAIRDYIYIDDVVSCYLKLLKVKNVKVVNIATGSGITLKSIIDYLKLKGLSIKIKNIEKDEIKISTACVSKLRELVDVSSFQQVIPYVEQMILEKS